MSILYKLAYIAIICSLICTLSIALSNPAEPLISLTPFSGPSQTIAMMFTDFPKDTLGTKVTLNIEFADVTFAEYAYVNEKTLNADNQPVYQSENVRISGTQPSITLHPGSTNIENYSVTLVITIETLKSDITHILIPTVKISSLDNDKIITFTDLKYPIDTKIGNKISFNTSQIKNTKYHSSFILDINTITHDIIASNTLSVELLNLNASSDDTIFKLITTIDDIHCTINDKPEIKLHLDDKNSRHITFIIDDKYELKQDDNIHITCGNNLILSSNKVDPSDKPLLVLVQSLDASGGVHGAASIYTGISPADEANKNILLQLCLILIPVFVVLVILVVVGIICVRRRRAKEAAHLLDYDAPLLS